MPFVAMAFWLACGPDVVAIRCLRGGQKVLCAERAGRRSRVDFFAVIVALRAQACVDVS